MTPEELRARAPREAAELGHEPSTDRRDHELWAEERRGAVTLLAALAECDASLWRRAALEARSGSRSCSGCCSTRWRNAAERTLSAAGARVLSEPPERLLGPAPA